MLSLCAGWQALVGPNGIWPRPNTVQPYMQEGGKFLQGGQASFQPPMADADAVRAGKPAASYAQLPLSFEANQGQTDGQVKFLSRGRGYSLFLTGDEAVLKLQESEVRSQKSGGERQDSGFRTRDSVLARRFDDVSTLRRTTDNERRTASLLRLKLVNANPKAAVSGAHELPGKVNYFLGNDPKKWRTNVPTYAQVRYRNVYPGIDLVYHGNQSGQLEYDFVVAPGADPGTILLAVDAAGRAGSKQKAESSRQKAAKSGWPKIDYNGDLVVRLDNGEEVRFHKPLVYQEEESGVRSQKSGVKDEIRKSIIENRQSTIVNRQVLEGHFALDAQNYVHFTLGSYDRTRALVIDPVLVYSTYLGGSGVDSGSGIAVDSSGNVYVTGITSSDNFPTANAYQAQLSGNQNAFAAKLNPGGSALIYSTYLGGGAEVESAIAVDSSGDVYLTGQTSSNSFPTTPGAFQTSLAGTGVSNVFVAELNPAGSALIYSTYLGGSGGDSGSSIAVNSSGDALLTGYTKSTNFPTASPYQESLAGPVNAFVAELNPAGSALVYSTYLGGSSGDYGSGIALDSSGNAYVTGRTLSANFPTTQGAFQTSLGGSGATNAFVTKLNSKGTALVYSTYLGGIGYDAASSIAVNSSGNAYVTGSAGPGFPTVNPLQASLGGTADNAFVTELNPTGSALVYSTYLCGSGSDAGQAIAVDSSGDAYVTGSTSSTNFPTVNPFQATLAGEQNAFVAELNSQGSALVYSTYLGGNSKDWGQGVAVDSVGNAYVAGGAISTDFPVINPLQATSGGDGDAFVAKISTANSPGIAFGPEALAFAAQAEGTPSASQAVTLTAAGSQPLILTRSSISGDFAFATTATSCPYSGGTVPAGTTCTIDVTFTPTATGTRAGSVTLNDDASSSPQTLSLKGTGVGASPTPVAVVSPSSLTFGSQLLGTTSAPQPVTLSNTGTAALAIASISTLGDFNQTNTCGGSLAAGGSCTINVAFTPPSIIPSGANSTTTLTGSLTITDNSRNATGTTQTVSLSGTWQDFTISIPSGSSSSATVSPGQSAMFKLSVGSEGGFNESVSLTCGGFPTDSTCVASPNSVAPGSNFTIIVTTTAPSAVAPRTLPQPRLPGPQALMMLAMLLAGIAWTLRAQPQSFLRSLSSAKTGERGSTPTIRRTVFLPLAAGLLLALALAGCGGGVAPNSNHGTPVGTYNLTVTGTAGSGSAAVSHSVTLTLNVS